MKKILITGSKGFVGKNLVAYLKTLGKYEIIEFNKDDKLDKLEKQAQTCDFVIHLAGVNRSDKKEDFMSVNKDLTYQLSKFLKRSNNKAPIFFSSSIQAELDNIYGESKLKAEETLLNHAETNKSKVFIYRLPNLFGKWSRPFYNSVVATWCHQIARDEQVRIDDPKIELELCYIDDLIFDLVGLIDNHENENNIYSKPTITYKITLEELLKKIKYFKSTRDNRMVPIVNQELDKKLYSTYLSFLPKEQFSYDLLTHADERGSFTEILKTVELGQISVNVAKPGIAKGDHWHMTKTEKFIVVSGEGIIRQRDINENYIVEIPVSGEKIQVVDMIPGYTHSIENTGESDLVTIIWANELFDEDDSDTYSLKVGDKS